MAPSCGPKEPLVDSSQSVWRCAVTGELVQAVEYRTQFRQCVEGAMGSLWKFEALLCSEQPLDEAVQLLSADEISPRTNQNGALLS